MKVIYLSNFGFKKSKKEQKEERALRLRKHQLQGAAGEELAAIKYTRDGYVVDRKHPKGGDMTVRKITNPLTGKVGRKRIIEVKTGHARTSKLQNAVRKQKKTKVERINL
jgi:hypothetical protein